MCKSTLCLNFRNKTGAFIWAPRIILCGSQTSTFAVKFFEYFFWQESLQVFNRFTTPQKVTLPSRGTLPVFTQHRWGCFLADMMGGTRRKEDRTWPGNRRASTGQQGPQQRAPQLILFLGLLVGEPQDVDCDRSV